MLYRRLDQHRELCILAISPDVLDSPGAVITDCNAASDFVRFRPAPQGLAIVDRDLTFAEYWTSQDPLDYWRRKAAKCAEVLVPDRVEPRFILRAYVSCHQAKTALEKLNVRLQISVDRHLFFDVGS